MDCAVSPMAMLSPRSMFSELSSESVMRDSIGIPQSWHKSILASDSPSSTCVTCISASFTFTFTFSPSARVATPSFIIFSTSLSSFFTRVR